MFLYIRRPLLVRGHQAVKSSALILQCSLACSLPSASCLQHPVSSILFPVSCLQSACLMDGVVCTPALHFTTHLPCCWTPGNVPECIKNLVRPWGTPKHPNPPQGTPNALKMRSPSVLGDHPRPSRHPPIHEKPIKTCGVHYI